MNKIALSEIMDSPRVKPGKRVMKIVSVEPKISNQGNDMVVFTLKHPDVEYTIDFFQMCHNNKTKGMLKRLVKDICASNPEDYPVNNIDWDNIEWEGFAGAQIGASLRYPPDAHFRLEASSLFSIDEL